MTAKLEGAALVLALLSHRCFVTQFLLIQVALRSSKRCIFRNCSVSA